MAKAANAFRTISEVSDQLDTPTHVLRFWESKFSQIKPVKRAGGRRYYRPQDIALLSGIKSLLHDDGMTIKSAQKLLRDKGVKHVAALGSGQVADPPRDPAPKAPKPAAPKAKVAPEPVETQTFFEMFDAAKSGTIRANADKIAPLVARLEAVHARMRQA